MTYQGDTLYQLQQIDLTLSQQQKRLQEIRHLLENNEAVQTAQAALTAAQADLKPRQTLVRDLELQSQAAKEKQAAAETRLYSGQVKNPRELQDMQNEIESLKRRLADLDEKLLEGMAAVEEKQTVLATAQATFDAVARQVEEKYRDLVEERVMIEARITRLQTDRSTLGANLTSESLRLYDTLKPQKANRPISLFTENTCSVCGIEQTALLAKEIRRRETLIKCRNCGRILVYMPK